MKILITVEGGMVTSVHTCGNPVKVVIRDLDTDEPDPLQIFLDAGLSEDDAASAAGYPNKEMLTSYSEEGEDA